MATAISQFAKLVAPDVSGCPLFVINDAVIDAIQQLCIDTNIMRKSFEHEVDYTTIDDTDNDSVTIDLTDYVTDLAPVAVSDFKIDGSAYGLVYKELLNDHSDIDELTVAGAKFHFFPDQDSVKFFPFQDISEDFYIYAEMIFKPKDGISTIDDYFYDDHREVIKAHALSQLQSMRDKAWTDLPQAGKNLAIYKSKMGEARIQLESSRVVGSTRITIPFF